MATKIRLARGGSKKRPFYRIVVTDSRSPRDGKFLEKLGTYNPLLSKEDASRVVLKAERVKHWLGTGATPTEIVERLFVSANLLELSDKRKKIIAHRAKLVAERKLAKQKEAEAEAKKAAEDQAA